MQALLLIAHIAQLAKRLIGEAAMGQQLALQLISTNNRDKLSVMTLATRVIERPELLRQITDPWQSLQVLRRQATLAINPPRTGS